MAQMTSIKDAAKGKGPVIILAIGKPEGEMESPEMEDSSEGEYGKMECCEDCPMNKIKNMACGTVGKTKK
jgi:hypothetical protein